ncbi:MAG: hypothetical protein ACRENS_08905 [Candidatus Eiseniibacteriota bacterium]
MAAFGLAALLAGCAHIPHQTGAMEKADLQVSANELHVRMIEFGRRVTGSIEAAADDIIARANDAQIRRDALLWKSYAVPVAQEAALRTDPLFAAGDMWAFTIQQHNFFESGAGSESFGPYHGIALTASAELEQQAQDFLGQIFPGDTIRARTVERIHASVAAHPFETLRFTRGSISVEFGELLGLEGGGIGSTVADMNRTVAGMYDRLGYINESLLKQVRWNTELMLEDALADPAMTPTLTATNKALDRLATLAEVTPELLDSLRDAIFAEVRAERIATLEAVSNERIAMLKNLTEQRIATLSTVHEERVATLQAAEAITARSVDRAERAGARLIRLAALLTAVLGVGALVLVLLGRRLWHVAGGRSAA